MTGYRLTATKPANSGYSASPIGVYVTPGEIMHCEVSSSCDGRPLTLDQAYALAREYSEECWDVVIDGPGDVIRFPSI